MRPPAHDTRAVHGAGDAAAARPPAPTRGAAPKPPSLRHTASADPSGDQQWLRCPWPHVGPAVLVLLVEPGDGAGGEVEHGQVQPPAVVGEEGEVSAVGRPARLLDLHPGPLHERLRPAPEPSAGAATTRLSSHGMCGTCHSCQPDGGAVGRPGRVDGEVGVPGHPHRPRAVETPATATSRVSSHVGDAGAVGRHRRGGEARRPRRPAGRGPPSTPTAHSPAAAGEHQARSRRGASRRPPPPERAGGQRRRVRGQHPLRDRRRRRRGRAGCGRSSVATKASCAPSGDRRGSPRVRPPATMAAVTRGIRPSLRVPGAAGAGHGRVTKATSVERCTVLGKEGRCGSCSRS